MPNPLPEKRVGVALLVIGTFSCVLYVANTVATKETNDVALWAILAVLIVGWFLRQHFKNWGAPPPSGPPKPPPKPPAPSAPAGAKPAPKGGGFKLPLPFGKKPAPPPPPPPKPAAPPPSPRPKGLLGRLDDFMKPKNKK